MPDKQNVVASNLITCPTELNDNLLTSNAPSSEKMDITEFETLFG